MADINIKESICWYCRHSSGSEYDDYCCPWDKEGRPVPGWMRLHRGFVIRCPHFVQEGIWRPENVFRGKWKEAKGVPYCKQLEHHKSSGRVVIMELGTMFPSLMDAARYLVESGRIKQDQVGIARGALYKGKLRNERSGRFQAYGLTFASVQIDERQGSWCRKIYEQMKRLEQK